MRKLTKTKYMAIALGLALVAVILWTLWGNTALTVNTYTVSGDTIPENFSGFRIAQISDLHNAEFGKNNEKLLKLLREAAPDILVITGDLVDSYDTDVEVSLAFVREAVKLAPCYYVTGNHEARISEYPMLKAGLEAAGVQVLENEKLTLEREGERITLMGVNDPSFLTDYLTGDSEAVMQAALESLVEETDGYTVLLSHRPELFEAYVQSGVDLVFSGHAHGGQFRLPFVGGMVAPNQGLFPEYDSGIYTEGGTHMLVSHGLGNSIIPIRFNNRPEIIVAELVCP